VKRLFWLGVGIAAGTYATRRATVAAQRLTPAGIGANIADGLRELGAGLGEFGAEVRIAMREHEQVLGADVQRRTGVALPSVSDALADPSPEPSHRFRDRARSARR
jgi:hypothetical protein